MEDLLKGRGAQINTANKFLKHTNTIAHKEGIDDWEQPIIKTDFINVDAKTLVNKVTSPDVGMYYSANPYQGCEHGCIYCYARNSHEYWGYSAGLDFESKILIKQNAPELLKTQLQHPHWQPVPISFSGNTDCYQPIEKKLQLTRKCLEIFNQYKHPVSIITKNALILRDIDLLQSLAKDNLVQVMISITGADNESFRQKAEPRTTTYARRFQVIKELSKKGIPVGVMNAPLIPGLNDDEMPKVLQRAAENGALWAGYTFVRLNGAIGDIFTNWISTAFPDATDKVLRLIKEGHGGQLNDSNFGQRMKGTGDFAQIIHQSFKMYCRKFQLNQTTFQYNTSIFNPPPRNGQLSLF